VVFLLIIIPRPLISIMILLRVSILLRLNTIIIVLRLLPLLVFGRGVLQPTQAFLEGLEGCITTHFESNRGVGGRITIQAAILRVGGVYYNPNTI